MILKYELPPLGCAALGAPSLDGVCVCVCVCVSPIEIGYFNIPEVEQFTPSRPRTFPFSTGFGYIESRVKLAMSDPLPRFTFIGKPTTNYVFCYSTSITSTLEKSR